MKLGLVMTLLSYPPALLLSVKFIDGRASRVHFSAVLGTTIVIASLWKLLLLKMDQKNLPHSFIPALISIHLSLLLSFSINLQNHYAFSWKYQQIFWSDVLELAPDITQNTVILVEAPNLQYGKQINPFDWSVPSVLDSIYRFPRTWEFPPRLYILYYNNNAEEWKKMIQEDGSFLLSNKNNGVKYHYEWEADRLVKSSDVILLVEEKQHLVRKNQLITFNGKSIFLKHNDTNYSLPPFPTSLIFPKLISSTEKNYPAIYFQPQS
jgi:hypothetical protein